MGTPVRNSKAVVSHGAKSSAILATEAAVSPPFVIEWRQNRSPDVTISPANGSQRKRRSLNAKQINSVKAVASKGIFRTPNHHLSTELPDETVSDDQEEHLPAKKPKPIKLETILELKSVVTAALRQKQQPAKLLSPTPEAFTNRRFLSNNNNVSNNNQSNDSLNDDSYNQLLSQIADTVTKEENVLGSPVQLRRRPSLARQISHDNENTTGISTPLRRKSIASTKQLHVPSTSKRNESSIVSAKKQIVSDEDDDDDLVLLAALEQVEKLGESNNHRGGADAPSSNSSTNLNKLQPKAVNLSMTSTNCSANSISNYPKSTLFGKQRMPFGIAAKHDNTSILTSPERAKIEAKRQAALSKLQQRQNPLQTRPVVTRVNQQQNIKPQAHAQKYTFIKPNSALSSTSTSSSSVVKR